MATFARGTFAGSSFLVRSLLRRARWPPQANVHPARPALQREGPTLDQPTMPRGTLALSMQLASTLEHFCGTNSVHEYDSAVPFAYQCSRRASMVVSMRSPSIVQLVALRTRRALSAAVELAGPEAHGLLDLGGMLQTQRRQWAMLPRIHPRLG